MNNQEEERPSFLKRHKKKIIGGALATGAIVGGVALARKKGTFGLGGHTAKPKVPSTSVPSSGPDLNKPRVVGEHSNLVDGWLNQSDKHLNTVLSMDPSKGSNQDAKVRHKAIQESSRYGSLAQKQTMHELNSNDKVPVNRVNFKKAALWKVANRGAVGGAILGSVIGGISGEMSHRKNLREGKESSRLQNITGRAVVGGASGAAIGGYANSKINSKSGNPKSSKDKKYEKMSRKSAKESVNKDDNSSDPLKYHNTVLLRAVLEGGIDGKHINHHRDKYDTYFRSNMKHNTKGGIKPGDSIKLGMLMMFYGIDKHAQDATPQIKIRKRDVAKRVAGRTLGSAAVTALGSAVAGGLTTDKRWSSDNAKKGGIFGAIAGGVGGGANAIVQEARNAKAVSDINKQLRAEHEGKKR